MASAIQFIQHPQRVWFRWFPFQVHLWTGIGVGLYVLLIGLAGSSLVFRTELEKLFGGPSAVASSGATMSFPELQQAVKEPTRNAL